MDNLWIIYGVSWDFMETYCLVVEPYTLKNMSSSIGMMNFPMYGKIKHVPNHQPAYCGLFGLNFGFNWTISWVPSMYNSNF